MIVNIRGTNGSGKTTIAKSLLGGSTALETLAEAEVPSPTKKDPDRVRVRPIQATVRELDSGEKLGALGRYANACGGCDGYSWKGAHDTICDAIVEAARRYRHAVFEGIVISSVRTRYLDLARRVFHETGQRTSWVFVQPPLEECLRRIQHRSGTEITERLVKNVQTKWGQNRSHYEFALNLLSEDPEWAKFLSVEWFEDTGLAMEYVNVLASE